LVICKQIVIEAKVLVQSKNLFRLTGILGPCLVDATTTQHLSLLGELLRALRHLYLGLEPIKWGAGTEHSGGNIICEQEIKRKSQSLYPL
jgi:hypothetical protein